MFLASNLKKPKENQCFCPIIALGVLLAILGTILAQNGPLGGPLGDLGHNLERHSLYSQTPDQPQSGRYLYKKMTILGSC